MTWWAREKRLQLLQKKEVLAAKLTTNSRDEVPWCLNGKTETKRENGSRNTCFSRGIRCLPTPIVLFWHDSIDCDSMIISSVIMQFRETAPGAVSQGFKSFGKKLNSEWSGSPEVFSFRCKSCWSKNITSGFENKETQPTKEFPKGVKREKHP